MAQDDDGLWNSRDRPILLFLPLFIGVRDAGTQAANALLIVLVIAGPLLSFVPGI
jgi:hypothetical protein